MSHPPGTATPSAAQAAATERIRQLLSSGRELLRVQRTAEAEAPLRQAVAEARQLGERATLAITFTKLANCLVQLEKTTEARALINEALSLWTPGSLESDRLVFDLQLTLAESFRYEQRPELSVEPFRAAVQTASRHEPAMALEEIDCARRLADVLRRLARAQEAAPVLEHALDLALNLASAQRDAKLASTAASVGADLLAVYSSLGHSTQADALFTRFHGIARQLRPDVGTFSDIPLAEVLGPSTSAPAAPTALPATPAGTTPARGQVSDAAEVVAGMRGDFRTCYLAALTADPQAQGSVRVVLRIGAEGRVSTVKAAALSLSSSTVDCVLRRAGSGRFNPPEGGSAVVALPLTFVNEKN